MRRAGKIVAAAALAAFLLYARRASAETNSIVDYSIVVDENAEEFDGPVTEGYEIPADFDWSMIDWLGGNSGAIVASPDQNIAAFLYMLRSCEHLERDVYALADYGTFFGGQRFFNFADHPVNTGEKKGVPLKPEWCRRAGFPSGVCVSTAAGAYQFTRPTWDNLRRAGSWGPRLPDFSPASQDEAARRLLDQIGALPLIIDGDVEGAIAIASKRWASLPGSTSGQPQKPMAFALAKFNEAILA